MVTVFIKIHNDNPDYCIENWKQNVNTHVQINGQINYWNGFLQIITIRKIFLINWIVWYFEFNWNTSRDYAR